MSAVVLPAAISHFTSTQVIFSNSTRLVWAHGGFSFTSSVWAPASVAVIPSTAKPATPTITLHTDLFMLPPLPLQRLLINLMPQHLLMNRNRRIQKAQ